MKNFRILTFSLIFSFTGLSQAKPAFQTVSVSSHSKQATCGALVYLDASERYTTIKAQPSQAAKSIAKLHDRQYLCVVKTDTEIPNWVLVKAVPFLNGRNDLCPLAGDYTKMTKYDDAKCGEMANYPVVWLSKQHLSTKSCRLISKPDAEGIANGGDDSVVYTKGVCATGWLPAELIHYFAD